MADAAHAIFDKPAQRIHRQLPDRRQLPRGEGVRDFDQYRVDPTKDLMPDFFVPNSVPPPKGVTLAAVA